MDKRVNISQNKDLDTNFKAYDQAYKKRLNHLIKGIFKILIKHGLVPFKKKETDNYHTGEVNGEFAELQNSTAIFIFDLLAKLKCIEDKKEGLPYNGNEKKDFIRSRLEDQSKELSLKNGMPNQEEDYYL